METGRRDYDNLSIANLYKDVRDIRKGQIKLQETLNNGLKHKTEENSEEIKKMCGKIDSINEYIKTEEAYEEGRNFAINILVGLVAGIGSSIISVLTILKLLGVL